jgi:phosphohistidine swiveling domain-containing protein
LDFNNGPWTSDLNRLDILIDRRNRLLESTNDDLEIIYWLNEDGKRYGTLPFAGLARAGFIAVQLLQSLVSIGILTQRNHEDFMESLSTISKDLSRDFSSLKKTDFIAKYGHLRPGTYDILSPRYDEAADLYFDWNKKNKEHQNSKPFMLSLKQMNALDKLLVTNGIKSSSVQILTFIQTAIEKREYAKFLFTKNVSDILSRIEKFGSNFGFSKNDLAHTKITDYKDMYYGAYDPKAILGNSISNGISSYKISNTLTLPPLIVSEEDVWSFEWPESFPNFITQKSVTASIVSVDDKEKLMGSIVLIPSADPGFDWVFSHQISGLITAYGGSNSHMAIRAGEIGLPAVIGTGELLYKKLKDAMTVSLDCAEKQIRILA